MSAPPRITDAQAKRWARAVFKAEGGGHWVKPPAWSQLVKLIDQITAEALELQRAVHDPTAPGAAEVIIKATAGDWDGPFGESGNWEDDFGEPVSDSDLSYYGQAFKWAAAGARSEGLRAIEDANRERLLRVIAAAKGGR